MIRTTTPTVSKINDFKVKVAAHQTAAVLTFQEMRNGWAVFEKLSTTAYERFRMEVLIQADRFNDAVNGDGLVGQGILAVDDVYGRSYQEFDF